MNQNNKYEEIWAVRAEEIKSFFAEADFIKGDSFGAAVKVTALPDRRVGKLTLPQTCLIIEGEKAEEIHRQFVLNFLRGGG